MTVSNQNNLNTELKMKHSALLTFTGNHDPFGDDEGTLGPVLSLLNERVYDRVYLIWTGSEYLEKAKMIEAEMQAVEYGAKFYFLPFELESVIDYEEIFIKLKELVNSITSKPESSDADYSVLLDPGTPQMQTIWLLLVKAGILKAELLQGVPARFTGGRYMVRSVDLESKILPEVIIPDSDISTPSPEAIIAFPDTLIISDTSTMQDIYQKAGQSAKYDVPVLIEGDTGTGKEVLARFIHDNSERSDKPFVPVNCAAVTRDLAESTFFGHVKGAFTGASANRPGYMKAADGGTLFLDEIGELPIDIQPKLLRALETGEFNPVGTVDTVRTDIRIIAATNRNLSEMIEQGTFRSDLYQRVNVVKLIIPPLRERKEDIPLLIQFFLSKWNNKYAQNRSLSAEALSMLTDYAWPRNVRELKSVVQQICCLSTVDELTVENMPDEILEFFKRKKPHSDLLIPLSDNGIDLRTMLNNIEARYYREAMLKAKGNAAEAARLLGISGPAFRKAIKERIDLDG